MTPTWVFIVLRTEEKSKDNHFEQPVVLFELADSVRVEQ